MGICLFVCLLHLSGHLLCFVGALVACGAFLCIDTIIVIVVL